MTYDEAMARFGTDRPDLRIPLELVEVGDLVKDTEFKVFAGPAGDPGGRVAAIRAPGAGTLARSAIDDYTRYVATYAAKGLAYIKVNDLAAGRDGCNRPSSSSCPTMRCTESWNELPPGRRPHLLRRGYVEDRQ